MSARVPTAPAAVPECWEARELHGRSWKGKGGKEKGRIPGPELVVGIVSHLPAIK